MSRSFRRARSYQVTEFSRVRERARDGRRIDRRPAPVAAAESRARPPRELGSAAGAQVVVDLAGDVPLQAADDLLLGQAFPGAPLDAGAGGGAGAHPGDHDPPQGVAGFAVPAAVEPVPPDLP